MTTRWLITFSAGAKPGKWKREDIIGTKESKKQYEINRERQFQQHWLDKTPWLWYDDGKGMTCSICCEQNISSKQGDEINRTREKIKNENELERESENDEDDKSREKIKTVESEMSEEETLRAITEYEIEYEFN